MEPTPKRKGGEEQDDDLGSKRLKIDPDGKDEGKEIVIRVLLEKGEVGSIIGKSGSNIKEFREQTGTQIDIHQPVEGNKERTATVKGSYWRVVNALEWMAHAIVSRKKDKVQSVGPDTRFSLTLLLFNSYVGSIIGRGGANIKEIRESTRAEIKISKTVLEGSSEKSVKVEGVKESFDKAIELIVKSALEAQENGARGGIIYQPRPQIAPPAPMPFNPYMAMHGYGDMSGMAGGGIVAPMPAMGGYGMSSRDYKDSSGGDWGGPPDGGPTENVVIQVPESQIGIVIGKAGSTINEIRTRSGATVQVEKRVPNQIKRTITITGSKQQTDVATAYISHLLSQPPRQAMSM